MEKINVYYSRKEWQTPLKVQTSGKVQPPVKAQTPVQVQTDQSTPQIRNQRIRKVNVTMKIEY